MATILQKPLTEQVTAALATLRDARESGDWAQVQAAQNRFDWLVDKLPKTAP